MLRLAILLALAAAPAAATGWRITALNGTPTSGDPVLSLDERGVLSGSTGCNRIWGSGEIENGRLTLSGPLATTRMACPAPLSEQEARLLELLGGEVVVEPEGDGFRLLGGGVTATLVAQEPAPDLGEASYVIVTGVDAALNIRAEPGTQSGVRARASLGRVMQSEGCEDRPDRLWCRVRFLDSSGTEGWAAADYLTVATAMRRAAAELFDEIGRLDCQPFGGAADRCEFGVARDAGVTGAMLVYLPDNHRLLLSYDGSDLSVSDGESEVAADVTPSGDGLRVATDLAVLSVPLAPFARR